jgi:hypothetical protein
MMPWCQLSVTPQRLTPSSTAHPIRVHLSLHSFLSWESGGLHPSGFFVSRGRSKTIYTIPTSHWYYRTYRGTLADCSKRVMDPVRSILIPLLCILDSLKGRVFGGVVCWLGEWWLVVTSDCLCVVVLIYTYPTTNVAYSARTIAYFV